jgi:hypothetical protein
MENSAGGEDSLIAANKLEQEDFNYWLRFDDLMYEQKARLSNKLLTVEKTTYIYSETLAKELVIQYAFMGQDKNDILY